MKKIISYIYNNPLFLAILFILVFIPLYPKIPILDLKNTWVYIRIEDFIVLGIALLLGIQVLRKKATIKTPLSVPIFFFWAVGLVSTVIAIIFIFPHLKDVFPELAFLHYARRIEYIILFFVGFSAIKTKTSLKPVVVVLTITLFLVVFYGFGQKYFGFPAFLTGNEEFAKGAPLRISASARVPSTFAGHYDLAAWLVVLIPIFGSLFFAWKKWWSKGIMLFAAFSGLIMLLMTASRVSFAMYLLSVSFMLILQKQKKWIVPVIILSLIIMNGFTGISSRFGKTISQVDLVIDARTGKTIGVAKTSDETGKLVIEDIQSTGENLPEGTGFINLPREETKSTANQVIYKRRQITAGTEEDVTTELSGDFVVKRGFAYDVSFTTRFQGTWPRAINAFKRNILTGSGYSSISLASDNNYLRILGEVGLLGMVSFLSIFLFFGIFVYRVLPGVESRLIRSFVIGMSAGLFGLALNATLIDVFEASKVAFVFWTLMGISTGALYHYQKKRPDYLKDLISVTTSFPMMAIYFLIGSFFLYASSLKNYFVGDDFTWLHWAAECKKVIAQDGVERCASTSKTILSYFLNSDNFFYRPGTKIYFYLMYPIAWLNSPAYHAVSLFLHAGTSFGVYLLALLITKKKSLAFVAGALFLTLLSQFESVLWVSTTGHLIAALCAIFSVVFYILSRRIRILVVLSFLLAMVAPLFHEFGITVPILLFLYIFIFEKKQRNLKGALLNSYLLLPVVLYLFMRYISQSFWSGGDYSYNVAKLPFNVIGNFLGYILIILFGTNGMVLAQNIRGIFRENIQISFVIALLAISVLSVFFYFVKKRKWYSNTIIFGLLFFFVSLLPFLGLGNISYRYSYLPSFGLLLFIVGVYDLIISKIKGKRVKRGIYTIMIIILVLFTGLNFLRLAKVKEDWRVAGEITYNTVLGLYNAFPKSNATPPNPVFYFINTPIRKGEAWVYPVGLKDSLWFSFQNENLTVHEVSSLDQAFEDAGASRSARFFEFDNAGGIIEVQTTIPIPPVGQ